MLRRTEAWHPGPCWLLLLLLWFSGAVATADAPVPAQGPSPASGDEGLLFELTPAGGGPTSYLFGTIHSEDPRVLALPQPAVAALASAHTLVLEMVPDTASIRAAAAAMRLDDGGRLEHLVPPELYQRCLEAAAARGLPEGALAGLKPWAVMLLMSMPPAQTGEFLDRRLYEVASAQDKPTLGLEATGEQLSLFEQFSIDEQLGLLRSALAAQAEREQALENLVTAYTRGALGELLVLSDAGAPGLDPDLRARFRQVVIDSRNARMLRRIGALPADRSYFIAVGALHLPGPTGLLAGLREAGFGVRRLY
jgi:hypothetical protein